MVLFGRRVVSFGRQVLVFGESICRARNAGWFFLDDEWFLGRRQIGVQRTESNVLGFRFVVREIMGGSFLATSGFCRTTGVSNW